MDVFYGLVLLLMGSYCYFSAQIASEQGSAGTSSELDRAMQATLGALEPTKSAATVESSSDESVLNSLFLTCQPTVPKSLSLA